MLGRIAADRGRRVVLVLDEFQEVVDIDPSLIKLMRSVFQEQPDVAHIYLGSKRHMMRRIFSDENEPFWRSAKQMELDVIAPGPLRAIRARQVQGDRQGARSGDLRRRAGAHRRPPLRHPGAALFPLGEREHWSRALEATLRSEHSHFSLRLGQRLRSPEASSPSSCTGRSGAPAQQRLPAAAFAAAHTNGANGARALSSEQSWCGGSAGANTASPSRSSRSGSSGTRARRACPGSRRRSPRPAWGCAPRARPSPPAPPPSPPRCPSSRTRSRRRGPSSCRAAP